MIIDLSTVSLDANTHDDAGVLYADASFDLTFWLADLWLDPDTTYTVTVTFDPTSPHETVHRRVVLVDGIDASRIATASNNDWLYNNSAAEPTTDVVTFQIGPSNEAVAGGWAARMAWARKNLTFDISTGTAVSGLEITPDPLTVAPTTPWPMADLLVSGSNTAALGATAGPEQPFFPHWWKYVPDTSQSLTLDTFASVLSNPSDGDTQLYVYSGASVDARTQEAFNDDTAGSPGGGLLSQVTLSVTAGVEYRILVGTYDNTGDNVVTYGLTAPFVGTNTATPDSPGGGGGSIPPDPPDPQAAFYLTEIDSTLSPALGKVPISYEWIQVSPATPVLGLHPDHGVLRFENPAVEADTDFVVRLTVTDNLGGVLTEDHTVHVKAHDYWTIRGGVLHGIQQVHTLKKRYTEVDAVRSTRDLLEPYTTVTVSDDTGWLATYTTGCQSVLVRRTDSPPDLTIGAATFTPPGRLLMLPAPFDGNVDDTLLDEMVSSPRMDLYDIVYAMVTESVTTINGVQVYGPNAYDAVADFNDYLGITVAGNAPDLALTGKISPAGFVRLVFGEVGLGLSTLSIPAVMADQAASGPGMQVIDPENYMPSGHLLGYLQMGDVLGFLDPAVNKRGPRATHVGIYLGTDSLGVRRFVSCRADTNGVSAADHSGVLSQVQPYTVPYPAKYTGWLVGARRY